MWGKLFGSLDLGKFTLGTVPGFIAGVAVLLLVDALTPGDLTASLLNEKSAGTLVVEAIIVILASAVLGTLVENLFHTWGRWFAGRMWMKLHRAFEYRNRLMENLGLAKEEFEWVQSKDTNKDKVAEVEQKYMTYTEVAGSAAYAIMVLAISLATFVFYELDQSVWVVFLVAGIIGVIAIILLLTSAASLAKYEMNKTMSAMDEIRGMSSHNYSPIEDREKGIPGIHLRWGVLWLIPLLGAIMIIPYLLVFPPVASHIAPTDGIKIISNLGSDNSITTLEVNVPAKTYRYASSTIISLNNVFHDLRLVGSDENNSVDLVQTTNMLDKPEWSLKVSLGNTTVSANNSVSLNVLFYSETTPAPGNWVFPVLVTEGSETDEQCLLAYIKVIIS